MGCLKSIIKKILIILALIAFFTLGGYSFCKKKINAYKNPPREEFIASERNYADFSSVSSDYQLSRSYNLFGYKKINAKYLPTGQKITIYDLKNEEKISPKEFETSEIDEKIYSILDTFKDSVITFQDFNIVERGIYNAKNKTIPYIRFQANVKNVPFKNVIGIIACYSTINDKKEIPSTKLVVTMTDTKAYNPIITRNFIQALKF